VLQESEQGWFDDPFGAHEHRYFSAGEPTKLVRDAGVESYDPPPTDTWSGPLVPVEEPDDGDARDMLRADAAEAEPYDPAKARRAALDAFDRTAYNFWPS
jgi:hypothetical protein